MQLDLATLTALRAFWRLFDPQHDDVARRTDELAGTVPGWSALSSRIDRGAEAALLRRAIDENDWAPYIATLRERGRLYATHTLEYASWTAVLRMYRDEARRSVRALPQDARVSEIADGMTALIDLQLEEIGAAYFEAKRDRRRQSEAQYEALFHTNPIPMLTCERETGRIVEANEAFAELSGYAQKELGALKLDALTTTGRPSAGVAGHAAYQVLRRDGELVHVEATTTEVIIENRPLHLVSMQNVTERERARVALEKTETQLRHAQKMDALGRLAGGIAHDFNNILTIVGSYACMLEDSLGGADPRHADAAEIRLASERATQITRRLLTLSRHSIIAFKPLDLTAVIAGFQPMLRTLVGEGIAIEIASDHLPPIIADAGQLEQVLLNLAINARDAMEGAGRLTIEAHATTLATEDAEGLGITPGGYVVLSVSDTGAGIPLDVQDKIFDPFFTTKDATQGTGLGLSIVHGIVTQARGAISVFSHPGRGASFRIYLPSADGQVAEPEAPAPVRMATNLTGRCILVVDDQREIRVTAGRVLRDAGCTVLDAANAVEARRICVSHDGVIHAALIDVVLSDGRGDELADDLRVLRPALKILLTSGYPMGAIGPAGDAPEGLLAKPFYPAQLREAIAQLLPEVGTPAERVAVSPVRPRILLVDDDADLRESLARTLRRAAFDVVEHASGRAGLVEIETGRVDVVLSDVHMPDGDGLELMRGVRRLDLDVPVVLMSGNPDVAAAATAVEFGAFRYLSKPIDPGLLQSVIGQAARAHALAKLRRQSVTVTGGAHGAADRAGLEVRFDHAVSSLWLAYQPVHDARTHALAGVEALMRSREASMPHPGALLQAATTLGRVSLLGRRVRQLAGTELRERADIATLFLNVHPDDLLDVELLAADGALRDIASRVVLEVTERQALVPSSEVTERLVRLREHGFRIAVDDIGAGYAGLASFAELKPEIVKIDISLVRAVHTSTVKQQTIRALCELCHEVGTQVVGEGVETTEERDCLTSLGCDLLQGFLFGRPAPTLPVR